MRYGPWLSLLVFAVTFVLSSYLLNGVETAVLLAGALLLREVSTSSANPNKLNVVVLNGFILAWIILFSADIAMKLISG
jgi:hypothetical protein